MLEEILQKLKALEAENADLRRDCQYSNKKMLAFVDVKQELAKLIEAPSTDVFKNRIPKA